MKFKMKNIIYSALIISLLQGCAGTRYSYTDKLEKQSKDAVLQIKKGEVIELLAVGDGFPGSWGYYPWVITSTQSFATVECKKERSFIPFYEPGIIFGGTVCQLIAHKSGLTTLFFGNKYTLSKDNFEKKVNVIISEN